MVPDYSVNAQGFLTIANSSSREILINSLQGVNKNDMPLLGRSFLSSAYLLVDQDHQQFTLWSANQKATEPNLIPIGPATCKPSSSIATPSPTSTASVSNGQSANKHNGETLDKGGIAGVVIGSLAGFVIVCLLLFRYLRRRHPHPQAPQTSSQHTATPENDDPRDSSYLAFRPEMPSDSQPPQEMPLERDTAYAVAPYEVAAEPSAALLERGRMDHAPGRGGRKDVGKERPGTA